MSTTHRHLLAVTLVLLGVLLTLTVRLTAFGIWDPWELNAADAARRLLDGETLPRDAAPFASVVALGFRALDVREWTGRLPVALFGVLSTVIAYLWTRRFAGATAGLLAAIVTATTPLFLINARMMLGEAPGFALQAWIAASLSYAALAQDDNMRPESRLAWFASGLVAVAMAALTRGVWLGVLPPLLAVATVVVLTPTTTAQPVVRVLRLLIVTSAGVAALMCARAIVTDAAEATVWLGSAPRSLKPPSFEGVIERVFHGFAPWSALLPVALGRVVMVTSAESDWPRRQLGWICVLWIAVGYGTHTLYLSRYGDTAVFLPVVALATTVALLLDEVHRAGWRSAAAGFVVVLLTGLLIRDFALYPGSPVHGLPILGFEVPKEVDTKLPWALSLGAFAVAAFVALTLTTRPPRELSAPYRLLRAQWQRNWPTRIWLLLLGGIAVGLLVAGGFAFVAPERARMSTLAVRLFRTLIWVPLAVPLAIALGQLAHNAMLRRVHLRLVPMLAAAAGIALYVAHGYLPKLSAHFSPREVYETYNRLATDGDTLAEYQVGGRAARYYARGPVVELTQQHELLQHLAGTERRWAAFPTDELATIDRQFRRSGGQHLFAVDTGSARIALVTNQTLPGHQNASFLVRNVLQAPPETIQHPTRARFEDKIEFLGYDLELPHNGYVGASESFAVTWYFRALKAAPGNQKIFVHIDGHGLRLNGDHEPIAGKYPVRMWDPNDVIVDRQELTVPANYRPGPYTIYLGFFSGNTRLKVSDGPKDDADRVRAGSLQIR